MHLLLLHGFTSHPVLTLGPLPERLKEAGWEVRQPALPGHGTRPEDLLKVRFQDWLLAAEEAYLELPEPRGGGAFHGGFSPPTSPPATPQRPSWPWPPPSP